MRPSLGWPTYDPAEAVHDARVRTGTARQLASDREAIDVSCKRALITGISGQDGSFLAELLVDRGYEVFGTVRGDPAGHFENLSAVRNQIELVRADLLDEASLKRALAECEPDEVYNLASVSFVPASWDEPVLTARFAAVGVTSLLEAIRSVDPGIRFYQASSSEIFGAPTTVPQGESTPLAPVTPYGVAKAYGHLIVRSYRLRYGLFACSGIMFNHESWRRPVAFVTRKIAHAAAAISLGLEHKLELGDLEARRDWGFAGDYVRAMWLMMQQAEPDDYVVATGQTHSVRELAEWAFARVGLEPCDYVDVDESLKRGPAELHDLVGDATKARTLLNWEPSMPLPELIGVMVDTDLERLRATHADRGIAC